MKLTRQRLMEVAGITSPINESNWNQAEFDKSVSKLITYVEDQGLYGDPDVKEVERLLKANKLQDAAEMFLTSFTDKDGGEGNVNFVELVDDVMEEFSDQVSLSNLK